MPERPERLDCFATLQALLAEPISLARFGDGECRMAYSDKPIEFQRASPALRERLHAILVEPKPGVLVGFNHHYRRHALIEWIAAYERYPKKYAFFRSRRAKHDVGVLWRPRDMLMYRRYWSLMRPETRQKAYGDACLFYLGLYVDRYADGQMEEVKDSFRALFRGRRALFVGPETPMGGASFKDELPKLKAIGLREGDFLAIPAQDAFEHHDAILAEIRRREFDDVFIQAGPAATVLAHDLAGTIPGRAIDAGSLNTQIRYLAEAAA